MTKLEELIERLCPDGVEYKEIGSIAVLGAGGDVPKARFSEEKTVEFNIPIYSNGIEEKAIYGYTDIPKVDEPSITISARGTIGWCALRKEPFYPIVRLIYVTPNNEILVDFLKYVIDTIKFKVPKTGIPQLTIPMVSKYKIPVPPLEVQREIVRILDKFTFLTAELAAELAARQKQYEYYRDLLLTFKSNESTILNERTNELELSGAIRWMKLGDIAKFTYGYTDKAKDFGNARFIRITDITEDGCLNSQGAKYINLTADSKKYLLNYGDLLLARTGATYGKTLYFSSDIPAVYASFLIKITLDNNIISNRFYWHFSKSRLYWEQAEKLVSQGGQQQFNTNAVSRVNIPVPPLEVQQRIVDILDRFDTLCNDISSGLPAEIEMRQKQYEYYRDKLLTFKELKKEA